MLLDLSDRLEDAVEWVLRLLSGLGFFLPIAIFAIFNLFSGKDKQAKNVPPSRPVQPAGSPPPPSRPRPQVEPPMPMGPFGWFGMDPAPTPPAPATGSRRSREDDPYRHDPAEALQWGSAFAANDSEKANSALRWGSVFDEQRERTKWGWDANEWGGDYAPKRSSEPKITVG